MVYETKLPSRVNVKGLTLQTGSLYSRSFRIPSHQR